MASNFVNTAPKLKKSFQSGFSFNQGLTPKNNEKDNYSFKNSIFTSNIGSSNIVYPLNENVQLTSDSDFNFLSNQMVPSGIFNVLKVDLDTNNCSHDIKLQVRYGHNANLGDSQIKYSTIISPNTQFYRNYPIENEYFAISLKCDDDSAIFNSVDGRVTLSRYTQYNAPVQITDSLDRFKMSSLEREGNDFYNDIIIGRVSDVRKKQLMAVMPSDYGQPDNLIWGIEAVDRFYYGDSALPLVVRSSSPSDSGQRIKIKGINQLSNYVEEEITLAGTSNAFTFEDYKFVGGMEMVDKDNTGDIICESNLTGLPFNFMAAGFSNSTSFLYTCPSDTKAIIKNIQFNGKLDLINNPNILVKKINHTSNTNVNLYFNNTGEGIIDTNTILDITLDSKDCVIGNIQGGLSNTDTANLGVSSLTGFMNVIEYSTSATRVGFDFE